MPSNTHYLHQSIYKTKDPQLQVYNPQNWYSPIEYPGLLEHIAKVDVGIQEVGVQSHRFFEMVDGEPYLPLGIEDAAKVAPGHSKVRPGLNGFQVTRLRPSHEQRGGGKRGQKEKKKG